MTERALAALRMSPIVLNRNAQPWPGSRWWWRNRTGHLEGCVLCGHELPEAQGRAYYARVWSNRLFCSSPCRQRAYRICRKEGVSR
jgi:hypothetical protein